MVGGIWSCKIGETDGDALPRGSDWPMRRAIERAYLELTGKMPEFLFSGWSATLTPDEQEVVDSQRSTPDQHLERCGWEWTDDIAQRRCDLPKGHTSGSHDWHSQRIGPPDPTSANDALINTKHHDPAEVASSDPNKAHNLNLPDPTSSDRGIEL